ncbi:MAG: AI-2E family transporter, partial [Candidatus Binatia bacterium]
MPMANTGQTSDDKVFVGRVVEAAIRLGLLVLLVTFCFLIIEVFIAPALWGIVIAVGIYPFYHKVAVALGNREKLAATLLTL